MILEGVETTWNEGARLRFFLNKPNKRGWGVVYLFCQLEGLRIRLSCGVKARIDYWNKGNIRIPFNSSKTDKLLHNRTCKVMEDVRKFVDDKVFSYLCGEKIDLIKELKQYTESIMGKKKTSQRFIPIWKHIIETDCDNEQSQKTYLGNVGTFENFMREKNIADDMEALTTDTIRMYREWLVASNRTANRSRQLINFIGNISNKMKQRGYTTNIDMDAIPPIKNLISKEESQESKVALNIDEIEALNHLKFDDSNERDKTKRIVRDLFLIQCYGGCRHEDLGLFLSSQSLVTDAEGNKFSVFTPKKTEKKGTTSYVPLNTLYPQLWDLWNKYKDYGNEIKRDTYNRNLRTIAERANLNREFTITQQIGTKKIVEKGIVYEELTSHDGRRTFITNMVRDFDMDADEIIDMSGHTDTKMVRDIYTSLTKDDKVKKVAKNVNKALNRGATSSPTEIKQAEKPSKSNNYKIDGKEEAIRVLSYLGVELTSKDIETLDFDDMCRMIGMKHSELMDCFGIDVLELKDLFNFHKPMVVRRALLEKMIEMMR